MSPDDAKAHILENVAVTRQMVTIAASYILENFDGDTMQLIRRFLSSVDAEMPQQVVLHQTVDPSPTLDLAASSISWQLAACEAVWNLVASGAVFPASSDMGGEVPGLGWTTVVPGSGGSSSGFQLNELSIPVPRRLTRARSRDLAREQPLTNADLYLKEVDLTDLHPEIEASLREAVKAFRHGLYLACLAMLGRAMETAWVELGLELARVAQPESGVNAEKLKKQMEDPFVGIAKKIQAVTQAYSNRDTFRAISDASGVTLQDLRNCVIWSDCVRESRNSLHYGAQPSMSNSYEKVAALLIGAVPHIRTVVRVTSAARAEQT